MASVLSFAAELCLAHPDPYPSAGATSWSPTRSPTSCSMLPCSCSRVWARARGEFFSFLVSQRAVVGLVGILSWMVFAAQFFSLSRLPSASPSQADHGLLRLRRGDASDWYVRRDLQRYSFD